MNKGTNDSRRKHLSQWTVLLLALRELPRRLPLSFYLILAIILILVLGVKGFSELHDPKRLAFMMVIFLVFFAAVMYRALIDAVDITRKHYREEGSLMNEVFDRDDFAQDLRQRVNDESKKMNESSDTPSNTPTES